MVWLYGKHTANGVNQAGQNSLRHVGVELAISYRKHFRGDRGFKVAVLGQYIHYCALLIVAMSG
jgi:hypothetical protein